MLVVVDDDVEEVLDVQDTAEVVLAEVVELLLDAEVELEVELMEEVDVADVDVVELPLGPAGPRAK